MAATFLFLNDSASQTWKVGVSVQGQIQGPIAVGSQSASPSTINDLGNSTSWTISISTSGILFVASAGYNSANPAGLLLFDANSISWLITVSVTGVLDVLVGFQPDEDFVQPGPMIYPEPEILVW